MPLLEVEHLQKVYTARFGAVQVEALRDVNFTVEEGEYVAIMGESGSGKTTLLNILAALDKPTSGAVRLSGGDITKIKDSKMSQFRREHLGFVFQDFNLLDTFSLRDNIFLPLVLSHKGHAEMAARLAPIARQLGIEALLDKYPYEVSGGQKQRLCIARTLLKKPKILILDDSTSAVDTATDAKIRKAFREEIRMFGEINRGGQTILMVTHSTRAASHAGRVLFIKDGVVFHQLYRGNMTSNEMFAKIGDTLTMLTTGGADRG